LLGSPAFGDLKDLAFQNFHSGGAASDKAFCGDFSVRISFLNKEALSEWQLHFYVGPFVNARTKGNILESKFMVDTNSSDQTRLGI
jgi:hypothetical protein